MIFQKSHLPVERLGTEVSGAGVTLSMNSWERGSKSDGLPVVDDVGAENVKECQDEFPEFQLPFLDCTWFFFTSVTILTYLANG